MGEVGDTSEVNRSSEGDQDVPCPSTSSILREQGESSGSGGGSGNKGGRRAVKVISSDFKRFLWFCCRSGRARKYQSLIVGT